MLSSIVLKLIKSNVSHVAAAAQWSRKRTRGCSVMSSIPVPLKTRHLEVSEELAIAQSVISRLWKRFQDDGNVSRCYSTGRPPSYNDE
ncbi:hypothetical protein TNCV_1992851 [Trichonephila clavipes]|nr:hypothetical protein TNCV_1992851 [Trichonephila clavipes]